MTNKAHNLPFSKVPKWLVWTSQAFLGLLFMFSATVKGIDAMGTSIKIGEYMTAFGWTVGESVSRILSFALIDFEFFLGLVLFAGLWRRVATSALVVFMFPLTLLTLYIAIANPVADCGCFGDALKISNTATFWKNIFLFVLAVLVFSSPAKMYRFVSDKYGVWVVLLGFILTSGGFVVLNSFHVPVIDFRPYKVGRDLYELTEAGKDGVYDYRFVYEKDGKERTFTMDELTQVDSTWIYVRDETVELVPPKDPEGVDLVFLNREGTPVTPELARKGANAILFVNTDLLRLRDSDAKQVLDAVHGIGEKVTLVMSESFERIDRGDFGDKTVPFDDILYLDKSTSLTLVRSNPSAVVVIGDGKIVRKASVSDFLSFAREIDFASDPYRLDANLRRGRNLLFGSMGLGLLALFGFGLYFRRKGVK